MSSYAARYSRQTASLTKKALLLALRNKGSTVRPRRRAGLTSGNREIRQRNCALASVCWFCC